MSIDSHFEVTENKEDSVRLHLPNYKGNQPMDFHIYLMEPFLFIAFTTEIEGEKLSTTNSYPQDMNQQDMFNATMASNLDRINQIIAEKYKKEEGEKGMAEDHETYRKPIKEEKKKIGIKNAWSLLAFAKEYGKMQVGEFANKDTGDVFKACIFTKPDGTRTFVAFAAKLGELTPKQIATMKDELQVVQLESGNYSLCKVGSSSWENVGLSKSVEIQQKCSCEQNKKRNDTDSSGSLQTTVWDELERQFHEFETLNDGQKHALYYYASLIGCDTYTRWHIEKSPQDLIDFQILLDISDPVAQNIASPNSYMSIPYRERDIKSIKNSYVLSHFMKVCTSLLELRGNKFAKEAYEEIISLIGTSTEQIKNWPTENNDAKLHSENLHLGKEIDLGLSVLWANMNIGASIETDNGHLYEYGDIDGKMTSENEEDYPQQNIINTEFDIAKTNWDNGWRMPTSEELEELVNKCKWQKISKDGIWGAKVTGPNGNSIFLPLAGVRMGKEIYRVGQIGMYWSGTITENGSHVELIYYSNDATINGAAISANGHCVRAVKDKTFTNEQNRYQHKAEDNEVTPIPEIQVNTACHQPQEEMIFHKSWVDGVGAIYSADKKQLICIPGNIENYNIIEGTEEINDYAFSNFYTEYMDYYEIVQSGRTISDCIHSKSELRTVSIPASINSVGRGIFDYCDKLAIIFIPNGTKEKFERLLPEYKDILVEASVLSANRDEGKYVWLDDNDVQYNKEQRALLKAPKEIEKYVVAEGTKTIGNAAFSNCEKLKTVILPDSIVEIGHYAFANCKSLYSFAIPNRVMKLGNGVFMDCTKLSSVRMPSGLTNVENDIFQGCDNLNSVFVPKDCKYKFDELLYGHDAITYEYNHQNKDEVEVLDRILHGIADEYGVLYDFKEEIVISATAPLENYSIRPGATGIRVEAFKPDIWKGDRKLLKRLTLPDSITMIGDAAFANNEGLEYINIPKNAVIFTDDNPFYGCANLHTIKWESEKTIKEGTLVYNKERTALIACLPWHYIGGVLNSWPLLDFARQHGKMQVGEFADKNTGKLFKSCIFTNPKDGTRVFVAFNSELGELTPQEIAEQKNELTVVLLDSGNYSLCKGSITISSEKQVEIPYGIETIAAHAFYHNEAIEEITLPPTLKAVGLCAFEGCSSLKVIYIPKGTSSKFREIFAEWKHLIVERSDMLPFYINRID